MPDLVVMMTILMVIVIGDWKRSFKIEDVNVYRTADTRDWNGL